MNFMPNWPASRWWRCAASRLRTSSARSCIADGLSSTARRKNGLRAACAAITSKISADTLQTSDGKAFLVRDCATPDGGRAVVFTDITEKTRAEDALAQAQRALEHTRDEAARQTGYLSDLTKRLDLASAEADNAKTVLLRTMSHELKTPLNAILGFSDLMMTLADNLGPDQVREYAGLIHQGGTNLFKMLNQIMDLTKISAGRYDLQMLGVDAGGMLWLARENFVARAAAKDIVINADACPIGLMAKADESVLTGMLNALIDNAVTFTQKGGGIELSACRDGASVRLSISDNGPGVAAADLGRILQPFEHAGRVADHAKGAGLRLDVGQGIRGTAWRPAFGRKPDGRRLQGRDRPAGRLIGRGPHHGKIPFTSKTLSRRRQGGRP